jgi:hypothetical protein
MKRGALYRARGTPVMSVMVGHSPTAARPRKSPHHCDYCGSQFGDMRPWDWPGDNPTRIIWLHERCEMPWYDTNGLPEGVEKTAHMQSSR